MENEMKREKKEEKEGWTNESWKIEERKEEIENV